MGKRVQNFLKFFFTSVEITWAIQKWKLERGSISSFSFRLDACIISGKDSRKICLHYLLFFTPFVLLLQPCVWFLFVLEFALWAFSNLKGMLDMKIQKRKFHVGKIFLHEFWYLYLFIALFYYRCLFYTVETLSASIFHALSIPSQSWLILWAVWKIVNIQSSRFSVHAEEYLL